MSKPEDNDEFDNSIRDQLLKDIVPEHPKPPCKITVIGAGMVGMACNISVLLANLTTNLVLIDVIEDKLEGEVLDLNHGNLFLTNVNIEGGSESSALSLMLARAAGVEGTTIGTLEKDYKLSKGSEVVIITAGARQQVGESRLSLVQRNVNIFKSIIPQVVKYSPDAVIIVISNPVDIMTYVTWKLSGFPRHRVFGSGTNLDSARFRYLIAQHLNVSPTSVHGLIIGEHGDSSVPLWSDVSVAGRRLACINPKIGQIDGPKGWDKIHKKVIQGAQDVIRLKGYTNWAIGLCCADIVRAIVKNKRTIQPVSCFVKGQAGITHDVCLSLPCVIGASGVSSIVQLELSEVEREALLKSAELINKVQQDLKW